MQIDPDIATMGICEWITCSTSGSTHHVGIFIFHTAHARGHALSHITPRSTIWRTLSLLPFPGLLSGVVFANAIFVCVCVFRDRFNSVVDVERRGGMKKNIWQAICSDPSSRSCLTGCVFVKLALIKTGYDNVDKSAKTTIRSAVACCFCFSGLIVFMLRINVF